MRERVFLTFPASCADKPLVGQLVRRFGLDINILRANINHSVEGKMLLDIIGERDAVAEGLSFLGDSGVNVKLAGEQVSVDDGKCVDCGACTGICLVGALAMSPTDSTIHYDASLCVGCLTCVAACPLRAISTLLEVDF